MRLYVRAREFPEGAQAASDHECCLETTMCVGERESGLADGLPKHDTRTQCGLLQCALPLA